MDLLIKAFGSIWRASLDLRIWGRNRGRGDRRPQGIGPGPAGEPPAAASNGWANTGIRKSFPTYSTVATRLSFRQFGRKIHPLVIHEALQAGVPVITANYGGMAEYVHHEENGLLFNHRDIESLAQQMQRLCEDPQLARRLGSKGYLQSSDGNVPEMAEHSRAVEGIYASLVHRGANK